MRVAFVVQRYGLNVNGGAELFCRSIAEHMSKYWDVEVITTCAVDYRSWKNEYSPGTDIVNGIKVRRFPVDRPRALWKFRFLSLIPNAERLWPEWMKAQGPHSTGLLDFLEKEKDNYDCFIFVTYLYCTTYFGLRKVREKAVLIPHAEDAPVLGYPIFKDIFSMPKAIIYNTPEEKRLVNRLHKNGHIQSDVIGVGVDLPRSIDADGARRKFNLSGDFVLYIGRITPDKGCDRMFGYFMRYKKRRPGPLKLVLIGKVFMNVPSHPDIVSLGFLSEQDKFNTLSASRMLIMPSPYESLSIVLLEAWLAKIPVLVNGDCEVMRGQCERSGGGLAYGNYNEFAQNVDYLLVNGDVRDGMGRSGREYVASNYGWDIIEKKYLNLFERI